MLRNNRGTSAIIAAMILVAILATSVVSVLTSINIFNQQINEGMVERAKLDNERLLENVWMDIDVLPNGNLSTKIYNDGPIPVRVLHMIVSQTDGTYITQISQPLTINSRTSSITIDSGAAYIAGNVYVVKVVTERGTLVAASYPPSPLTISDLTEIAEGLGPIFTRPGTSSYVNASDDGLQSGILAGGYPFFALPKEEKLMFSVNLTNLDPKGRSIILDKLSSLRLDREEKKEWHIAEGLPTPPDGKVVPYNSTQPKVVIPFGQEAAVNLGAKDPGKDGIDKSSKHEGVHSVYLLLFGSYSDGLPYIQTISFHATIITKAELKISPENGPSGTIVTATSPADVYEKNIEAFIGWINPDGTITTLTTFTVQGDGSINTTFQVPAVTPRFYVVMASDGTDTAFATFEVTP